MVPANPAPLELVEISRVVHDRNVPPPRGVQTHSAHELIHVLRGDYRALWEDVPLDLGPGELVVYPAGTSHRTLTPRTGELVIQVLQWRGRCPPVPASAIADQGRHVAHPLQRLAALAEEEEGWEVTACRAHLLAVVVHELALLVVGDPAEDDPREVAAVRCYLARNFQHSLDLEHLCARFGISRATLCRRFRAAYGTSPMRYLQEVRVAEARELAANTAMGMAEIAAAVGIAGPSALARTVKRVTGTPLRGSGRLAR